MAEEKKQPTGVGQRNVGHRFPEGHTRFGGRKKRTAQMARELADELGCDPLRFMMQIINADTIEQTVIENGKKKRVTVAIPLETRMDAAKTVANYLYPRLSAQQITGANDGPVEMVGLDLTAIMADPSAQRLAMLIASQEQEAGLAERGLPAPGFEDHPDYER